ncbi:sigma-54-dependent Fis family transcriptional regulator [Calothrix sp. FACHB-1219]|uniref:sigma-54-dependent Fis family transcriptional regulator n=1 Tax=unclassified Calothrix TaxID=2619626 RepID=UPI0016833057|nr:MULTISPECIES: sigma-54-dependent Fis family transcriptional regulator [unclassified Calothrix]MBD2204451.1 sigma-54-dependent Fis family transcriptional regulator [Calothrix sp. FACHB-168]MBD2216670.1 sigma-54-dependent Fis family transcriptional regulator [Calothrix sp. FACHB-1219]
MSALTHNAFEAGRVYKSTGAIPVNLLRSPIYHAWERSHLQGSNPYALQAEKLSIIDTERLVGQNSALINAARPYFRILSQAAGSERHAVMLGDRNAVVLDVVGDEQTVHGPEPFPLPGSLLSESVAGANGIGTPLAAADYIEIIAAEHFIEGFHSFTCQGIPLKNDKQEIIGVFSISLRRADAGQRLKEILKCASHGIEAEFVVSKLEQDVRRILTANPEDYQPIEELRQDIIQAHQAARLKMEIGSRMVANNRLDYAMQILRQADNSIQLFRRRAEVWQSLASLELGVIQPVCLTDSIRDLVDLLSTEISIRKLEVVTYWQEEPIHVLADSRSLLRQLFRYFLQIFEIAGKGGKVKVAVDMLDSGFVQVSFIPNDRLNLDQLESGKYTLSLPLANHKL